MLLDCCVAESAISHFFSPSDLPGKGKVNDDSYVDCL
jgi:hypothetical protein